MTEEKVVVTEKKPEKKNKRRCMVCKKNFTNWLVSMPQSGYLFTSMYSKTEFITGVMRPASSVKWLCNCVLLLSMGYLDTTIRKVLRL